MQLLEQLQESLTKGLHYLEFKGYSHDPALKHLYRVGRGHDTCLKEVVPSMSETSKDRQEYLKVVQDYLVILDAAMNELEE
ncbi:hypothetical protein [Ferrimonas marina]|uniref:Uncharacterized protein n=1 Tax=Ferrimonas marina TaxID=299255 RepID=A0A1M5UFL7_9GAMM|nr:hypothetical protein [Ferrimonas marina]SHH61453.1 hypothetical protein SAMN02745129_2533 [Ferrimonas marina]